MAKKKQSNKNLKIILFSLGGIVLLAIILFLALRVDVKQSQIINFLDQQNIPNQIINEKDSIKILIDTNSFFDKDFEEEDIEKFELSLLTYLFLDLYNLKNTENYIVAYTDDYFNIEYSVTKYDINNYLKGENIDVESFFYKIIVSAVDSKTGEIVEYKNKPLVGRMESENLLDFLAMANTEIIDILPKKINRTYTDKDISNMCNNIEFEINSLEKIGEENYSILINNIGSQDFIIEELSFNDGTKSYSCADDFDIFVKSLIEKSVLIETDFMGGLLYFCEKEINQIKLSVSIFDPSANKTYPCHLYIYENPEFYLDSNGNWVVSID